VSFGPVFQASITELSFTHLDLFFHSQFEPLYTFFRSRCIWFLGGGMQDDDGDRAEGPVISSLSSLSA